MAEHVEVGTFGTVLQVSVIRARNLAACDSNGFSDPYCVLKASFNKQQQFRTRVIKKSLDPVWEETFNFYVAGNDDAGRGRGIDGSLHVRLWDKDKWTADDFLGEVTIPLTQMNDGKPHTSWCPLSNEPKVSPAKAARGELLLRMHYPFRTTKKEVDLTASAGSSKSTTTPAARSSAAAAATTGGERRDSKPPMPVSFDDAAISADSSLVSDEEPVEASASQMLVDDATLEQAKQLRIEDFWEVGDKIGEGGFSIVYLGTRKNDGLKAAIKVMDNKKNKKSFAELKREVTIMQRLKHAGIVQLFDVFETKTELSLVLELVDGGELFDEIIKRGHYSEYDAMRLVRQVMEAMAHMHRHGVAHRDLKPENLLLAGASRDTCKISDFGLSKEFGESGVLHTRCGTPYYVAPEVVKGLPYASSVDIWSMGVITYILLCGYLPFYDENFDALFSRIVSGSFSFPAKEWGAISDDAKDLIRKMLTIKPAERISAEECLAHPWFEMVVDAEKPSLQKIDTGNLVEFCAKMRTNSYSQSTSSTASLTAVPMKIE